MSARTSFRIKACPVRVPVPWFRCSRACLHHKGTYLRGFGIAAILIFLFFSIAWGNTQDQLLAEKFSPILILTEHPSPDKKGRRVIFPEPVEIMSAKSVSNLYFSVLELFPPSYYVNTYQYSTTGWNPDLLSIYESRYSNIDFSQNRFAFLDTFTLCRTTTKSDRIR